MVVLGCFWVTFTTFIRTYSYPANKRCQTSLCQSASTAYKTNQESISAQNEMRQILRNFFGHLLWFYATAKAAKVFRFFVVQLFQLKRFCRCLRSHSFCKSSWHHSDPGVGNQWCEPIWPTVGSYGLGLGFFYFLSISYISMICGKWVGSFHFSCQWYVYLGVNHHQTHPRGVLDSS